VIDLKTESILTPLRWFLEFI